MTPVFWILAYSPWSERARWALEYCQVEHRRRSYQPLLDELALRRALRRWRGVVSVPILQTDGAPLADSFDIAAWANARANADRRLWRDGELERVRHYDQLAGRGLAAGRSCSLQRVLRDQQGLLDLVPRGVRRLLGPLAVYVAAAGVRRTLRKYAAVTPQAADAALIEVLETLRADLAAGSVDAHGVRHLLPAFSYADVTMAQVLVYVHPPATHLRLSDANRATFRDAALAERFADLVAWRDGLYAHYRDA